MKSLTEKDRELLRDHLFYVIEALEENGIKYWIDYGTLLGAVRDGRIIPWDKDTDIGVLKSDYEKIKQLFHDRMADGIKVWSCRSKWYTVIKSPEFNGRRYIVDLFFWDYDKKADNYKSEFSCIKFDQGTPIPKFRFENLETIEFEGRTVKCPNLPKSFVETKRRYGKGAIQTEIKEVRSGINVGVPIEEIRSLQRKIKQK